MGQDDKGESVTGRNRFKEFFQRFDAACRGADTDYWENLAQVFHSSAVTLSLSRS
jgi:hypothetical protein